jgi:hypothetical protein
MYGISIYTNIGGILMGNVTIYSSTKDPMGYETVKQTVNYGAWIHQEQNEQISKCSKKLQSRHRRRIGSMIHVVLTCAEG